VVNQKRELERFKDFLFELTSDEEIQENFEGRFNLLFGFITTMRAGTTRLKELVEDLRLFSSLGESEYKPAILERNLRACIHLVQAKYREHIDFIMQVDKNIKVHCFQAELNQAIMNIMMNACQAIVEKREQQSVSTRGTVSIGAEIKKISGQEYVVVSLADNGCGMSVETRARMFEPFFTTRTIGDGTGLGLSITYGIVEQHKGQISVDSREGEGTEVRLSLPLEAVSELLNS